MSAFLNIILFFIYELYILGLYVQVEQIVPGATGINGLTAPRPVVEESNQEKGIATLVENVRGELLSPRSVITTNVSQTDDIFEQFDK